MNATATPNPFLPEQGFTIDVTGATPPFTYEAKPSPPNPPGVVVNPGPPVLVTVPANTPADTLVQVTVTDSSSPPKSSVAVSRVA